MKDRNDQPGRTKDTIRAPRFVNTPSVKPYDGVGHALARAYPVAHQAPLPADMRRLLDRLDRPHEPGRQG